MKKEHIEYLAGGTPINKRTKEYCNHRVTPTLKVVSDDNGNDVVLQTTVEAELTDDMDYRDYKISALLKAGIDPKTTAINPVVDSRLGLDSKDYEALNEVVNSIINPVNDENYVTEC